MPSLFKPNTWATLGRMLVAARGRRLKQTCFPASGNSMMPLLKEGFLLSVEPMTRTGKSGDIILFSEEERLVAHRVIAVKSDCRSKSSVKLLLTKGDNSRIADGWVQETEVVGLVVGVVGEHWHINLKSCFWKSVASMAAFLSRLSCCQKPLPGPQSRRLHVCAAEAKQHGGTRFQVQRAAFWLARRIMRLAIVAGRKRNCISVSAKAEWPHETYGDNRTNF
jgi:signal peptidase I